MHQVVQGSTKAMLVKYTSSNSNTEVEQHWVRIALGWKTAHVFLVLLARFGYQFCLEALLRLAFLTGVGNQVGSTTDPFTNYCLPRTLKD